MRPVGPTSAGLTAGQTDISLKSNFMSVKYPG